MKPIASLLAAIAFVASPAFAGEPQAIPPDANGQLDFLTPSQNIECIYTPAGGAPVYVPESGGPELQCDRAEPEYLRFILGPSGPAAILDDVGDASCCGGTNILAYGNTWSEGEFTCTSATTGLTCTRGENGFFISKAKTEAH